MESTNFHEWLPNGSNLAMPVNNVNSFVSLEVGSIYFDLWCEHGSCPLAV